MRVDRTTGAVLIVLIVSIVAVLLVGPEDVRGDLLAGLGMLGGMLLSVLGPVLRRDTDGDGVPDVIDTDGDTGA